MSTHEVPPGRSPPNVLPIGWASILLAKPKGFGTHLGVSLAAPKGVSKRMGFKMASFLNFEKFGILVPVCFGTRLGVSKFLQSAISSACASGERHNHVLMETSSEVVGDRLGRVNVNRMRRHK